MKHNVFSKFLVVSSALTMLYGCSGDPAFESNPAAEGLQIGTGIGSLFTAEALDIDTSGANPVITVHVANDVGQLSTEGVEITFESPCSANGQATFSPATATNSTGVVSTTYTNISCSAEDSILASTNSNPILTATGQITAPTVTGPTGSQVALGGFTGTGHNPGQLTIASTTIAPGGNTLITVDVVDSTGALTNEPMDIDFLSSCVDQGLATFDNPTVSITGGTATVLFTDLNTGCSSTIITASGTLTAPATTATFSSATANGSITIGTPPPVISGTLNLGSGTGSEFDTELFIQTPVIASGGTANIFATIVDENSLLDTSTQTVTFTAYCNGGTVAVSPTSVTAAGTFSTTFTDTNCPGTASVTAQSVLNGATQTVFGIVTIDNTSPPVTSNPLSLGSGTGAEFSTELFIQAPVIAPGGTTNVFATIVDENNLLDTSSQTVTFTAYCNGGTVAISPASVTANGSFSTTFTDTDCPGAASITAQAVLNGTIQTAFGTVTIDNTAPPVTSNQLFLGSGTGDGFTTNLFIQNSTVAPGGSTQVSATIVDANNILDTTSQTVNFTAYCNDGTVAVLPTAVTSTGSFTTTFTDTNCVGTAYLTAQSVLNGATQTIFGNVIIDNSSPTTGTTLSIGNGIGIGFSNGAIHLQDTSISSGGSTELTVNIVDDNNLPDSNLHTVNFVAQCDNQGTFTLPASISSATGAFTTTFTDTSCDGNVDITAYATLNGTTKTASATLSVGTATGVTNPVLTMGNNFGPSFDPGNLAADSTSIGAGDTVIITVSIVDESNNLSTIPVNVTFNSYCSSLGLATLITDSGNATTAVTDGGTTATYIAQGCDGTDTIVATATSVEAGVTISNSATIDLTVAAPTFNGIEFVSTSPAQIGIQGMGFNETSIVTFKVTDESSGPFAGQAVNFTLSNDAGGARFQGGLTTTSGTSGSNGEISVVVTSGKAAANFQVIASSGSVSVSSSQIVVQDAIPSQASFSIHADTLNLESFSTIKSTTITATVSDRYQNPVPDGQIVNFRTECGSIESSCETTDGTCSVQWNSGGTSCLDYDSLATGGTTDLGKVTVLAFIEGEEEFIDDNDDGEYTSADDTFTLASMDKGDAFVDNDDDGIYDAGQDQLIDHDGDGNYDAPDGLFNGALCVSGCGALNRIHVRDSLNLIQSASDAVVVDGGCTFNGAASSISSCTITITDSNGNIMPAGTAVEFSSLIGSFLSRSNYTVPNLAPMTTAEITAATQETITFLAGSGGGTGFVLVIVRTLDSVETPHLIPVIP